MARRAPSEKRIAATARDVFGFDGLRPGQADAIRAAVAGRDTLVVMSTGSGKSAIYQIAGVLVPGATLVVSPLISLQRDQIDAIDSELPGEASSLDASVGESTRERRLRDLAGEELEFLFLAPEQLGRPETVESLADAGVSLLVVDEAHCISEWGHDFRPDYLRLGALVDELGHPTVLGLTATASPPVREEIVERLRMREPEIVVRGFDRPNLRLAVEPHREEDAKRAALVDRVMAAERPGIVYVATRREAEELAQTLADRGVRALPYHAGLSKRERDAGQERFMDDEVEVIVATTAFGMGVDKPNVRFVFHLDPSDSVDSYYQEIGRGGRDDEPAEAVLFYRPEDIGRRRFFAAGGVDGETIEQVAEAVAERTRTVAVGELQDELELSETKVVTALSRLEDAGAVRMTPDGRLDASKLTPDEAAGAARAATELEEERRSFDRSRLEMMRAYAEHEHCRRVFILTYFGERYEGPCGNCDNCAAGRGVPDGSERPFEPGTRVNHAEWGEGVVQRYDDGRMVVLFDAVGYRTLDVELVADRGLLERA
jgi:ATP-dependent DNA helicase RecQ